MNLQKCVLTFVVCVAAALMVTVFGVAVVDAQDTITFGGSFPTAAEVIAATPDEATFGDDANASLAQTFSVNSTFLAGSIFLEYENDANANIDWSMTATIFEVADVQAATLVAAGGDVYTGTFTFPAVGGTDTIARIGLATPLLLNASVGTAGYAIQITEATGGDFNPGWEWLRTTNGTGGSVYDGGHAYENGVEKGSGDGARDFSLAISSIPEPGSLGLISACAIGALMIRRRK